MDEYLVSQRQAAKMLVVAGLSRRAAYYQLESLPSRVRFDTKVYARVDVELLRDSLTRAGAADVETGSPN